MCVAVVVNLGRGPFLLRSWGLANTPLFLADLQCPADRAPKLLSAALPRPATQLPMLYLRHRAGGWLFPTDCTAPGKRPGPGQAVWQRYSHPFEPCQALG